MEDFKREQIVAPSTIHPKLYGLPRACGWEPQLRHCQMISSNNRGFLGKNGVDPKKGRF